MDVEVVVPFAGDCPHRRRALDWTTARYPWPVRIAPGGEPWVKAEAVMPAIEASDAEIIVVADADCWTDPSEAVERVRGGEPWAIPHRGVHRLTEDATERLLAGEPWRELPLDERAYLGWEGGGVVVAPRRALLDVPLDPLFTGWGCEDESWALALNLLVGHRWRGKEPLVHLWHPPQPRTDRRQGSPANFARLRRYVAARHDPAAMRALLTEAEPCR